MAINLLFNKIGRLLFILSVARIMIACTPNVHPAGIAVSAGQLLDHAFIAPDGAKLPLKVWKPTKQKAKAVIIALHGFNDYSHFFLQPGLYFSQQRIISYAYDQRGFGGSPNRGLWAGVDTYISDLENFIRLIKIRYPAMPLYLLGESMGGAIIISTLAQSPLLPVDGIVLAAPAVWARQTMPWYQNALLWGLSHTVPWITLTGEGLDIKPSDNIEMLIALGKDPMVIKETRIEAIYGLVNLMDQAVRGAEKIRTNTLLLYGEKDEIIPKQPAYQFLQKLTANKTGSHLVAFYKDGYHMLLRDLRASVLWRDVNSWINSFTSPLPSGADKRALQLLKKM